MAPDDVVDCVVSELDQLNHEIANSDLRRQMGVSKLRGEAPIRMRALLQLNAPPSYGQQRKSLVH